MKWIAPVSRYGAINGNRVTSLYSTVLHSFRFLLGGSTFRELFDLLTPVGYLSGFFEIIYDSGLYYPSESPIPMKKSDVRRVVDSCKCIGTPLTSLRFVGKAQLPFFLPA